MTDKELITHQKQEIVSLESKLSNMVPKIKLEDMLKSNPETGFPDSRKTIIKNLKELLKKEKMNKLKEYRANYLVNDKPISMKALADKINVTRMTIFNIENGSCPSKRTAKTLANFFDCTIDEMFNQ